jgi:hypothetical protein
MGGTSLSGTATPTTPGWIGRLASLEKSGNRDKSLTQVGNIHLWLPIDIWSRAVEFRRISVRNIILNRTRTEGGRDADYRMRLACSPANAGDARQDNLTKHICLFLSKIAGFVS